MPEEIHPGSWVGDTVGEFKKLPTWGKFAAVGALVAAAGIGYYEYNKAKSTSGASVSSPGSTGTSLNPNAQMGGTQSPFAQVPTSAGNGSTVPVIPFGDTPLFDSLGNLIGWQQPGATAPGGTTPTPATSQSYTILSKGGQTLHNIAAMFGISYADLYGANKAAFGPDINHAQYSVGETITVPTLREAAPVPSPKITKNKQTSPPPAKKVVKK